ncbi:MAG: CPBP family intramembrane glutamic endopeptidase [Phycisphaerae bacterium]
MRIIASSISKEMGHPRHSQATPVRLAIDWELMETTGVLAVACLFAVVPVLWIGQTLLLRMAGLPVRWRLDARDGPEFVRRGSRALTYASLGGVIVIYPILRGESPGRYYAELLPAGAAVAPAVHGFAVAVLYLALLYLAWWLAGNVTFSVRHPPRKLAKRLAVLPLTAVLGAGVEELLFRGVLLRSLLESFSASLAVPLGALIFAAAHYVRPVKRRWTFPGHVMLGLCLCLAFVWTNALWLPFGVHAGGILVIMAARPFVRYEGPAWLTGASVFPYAGVVGVAALALMTTVLWLRYGAGA